jgi:DNA-binding NarL/FixJ family response regulator
MRILLADAQALTREGLKRVALEIDAASEFVEAADGASARAAFGSTRSLDAALFDDGLLTPGELAEWRHDHPGILLIALSGHDAAATKAMWLAAGVDALVPKSASMVVLAAALRLAMAGDVCVRGNHPALTHAAFAGPTPAGARRGSGPLKLTARQYDVLARIAQGRSNKAIATDLGIGLRTVKGHVSVILRALHADNRADAGRAARRWLSRAAAARESSAAMT